MWAKMELVAVCCEYKKGSYLFVNVLLAADFRGNFVDLVLGHGGISTALASNIVE